MSKYIVSVKTSSHVKIKRSWIYEGVEAENTREAAERAALKAAEWWGLWVRDITVVSVDIEVS